MANKYKQFSKAHEHRQRPETRISSWARCLGKKFYETEEDAISAAGWVEAHLNSKQYPYQCPHCYKYHLTSKPQKQEEAS